jgi:hypothetical protein
MSEIMFENVKVGDKVLLFRQRCEPVETTIKKVGRKYLEVDLDRSRFLRSNGTVEQRYGHYIVTPEEQRRREMTSLMIKNLQAAGVDLVFRSNHDYEKAKAIYDALRPILSLSEVEGD